MEIIFTRDDFFMKKFLVVLFMVLLFAFGLSFKSPLSSIVGENAKIINGNEKVAYAGANLGFICEDVSLQKIEYKENECVVGECVFIDKSNLAKVASDLGLVVLKKYSIGERQIIEAYSPVLKYFIDGVQSNIQICIDGGNVQIGSPIIYGSF